MNTSSQSTIDYLNCITRELNRYIPLAFLVLGTIGNLTNILVFIRPTLRTNACSIYFISSSIINFPALYVGLITPFLGLYNLDPTQTNDILCKIRFYLRYSTITLSTWFILLACIDRYMSSSSNANIRSWSSIQFAKRFVCLASLICFLMPYTQVFYCYTVSSKKSCTYQNRTCTLVNDIILLLCNSGFPPILMVIFSILTIQNVKHRTRVINNNCRKDAQLIRILLIQVSIFVLFAIPVTIQKVYTSSTSSMTKTSMTTAIESLINQISIEVSYISNSTTFYIYSITSKKYRKEVIHILSAVCKYHQCMNGNRVQPVEESRLNPNLTVARITHKQCKSNIRTRDE